MCCEQLYETDELGREFFDDELYGRVFFIKGDSVPDEIDCMFGHGEQKVIDTGVGNPADPTQWYKLACGDVVI
jgi:hypothetical protein